MCQSAKKDFIFLIFMICFLSSISACSSQTINPDQGSGEVLPTRSYSEAISTPTTGAAEPTPTVTPTLPEMKVQTYPTFNATLHTDEIAQPHLLAIIGKNNPDIKNEALFSFASDGKSFIVQDGLQLSIWRTSPLKEIHLPSLRINGTVQKIAVSDDNHYAAAILLAEDTGKASLLVWKMMSGELILEEDLGNDPDLQPIDRQLSEHWDTYDVSFLPGTTNILYKSGKSIFMLDPESNSPTSRLHLRDDMTAQKFSFPRDGRFVYILMYSQSTEGKPYYQVQIWDTNTLKLRESISLEDLTPNIEVDVQAAFVLIRDTEQLTLQKISMENEEAEDLPYRLGPITLSADGHFLIFQHTPEDVNNRQVDIELWAAYNWRTLYIMDNDGKEVNMDYPIDLSKPGEVMVNKDHSLMAVCTNGKTYLYDVSGVFTIK